MSKLRVYTYADIRGLELCYDPVERGYITIDWSGTVLDVLKWSDVPAEDRLWLALHAGWAPNDILHEFAVWCAEQALALTPEPDPRSVAALEVKRRWIKGEATDEDLKAAERDAWAAALWAARAARPAWAAESAAWAAALWAAARQAAESAAQAAESAAWDAQVTYLIDLLEAYERESTQ